LWAARQISGTTFENVMQRLNKAYYDLDTTSFSMWTYAVNSMAVIRYWVIAALLVVAEAAAYVVVAWGYLATAVCAVVGPLFIPFFILPSFEWLFWGWFKAFLQYCFYPVVAYIYIAVMGNVLLTFFDLYPGPYSADDTAAMFASLVILLLAWTFGFLNLGSLVRSIFSGSSGETAHPTVPGVKQA
jgi:type IV secretory pathway VirB6-like protein